VILKNHMKKKRAPDKTKVFGGEKNLKPNNPTKKNAFTKHGVKRRELSQPSCTGRKGAKGGHCYQNPVVKDKAPQKR